MESMDGEKFVAELYFQVPFGRFHRHSCSPAAQCPLDQTFGGRDVCGHSICKPQIGWPAILR